MPYGGLKASGIGKEGFRTAVSEMTEEKTIILHAAGDRGRPTARRQAMTGNRTLRLTTAQALVLYLSGSTASRTATDGGSSPRRWGSSATATWPASDRRWTSTPHDLPFIQGRNEQGLVHVAIGVRQGRPAARRAGRHRVDRPRRARTWSPAPPWRRSTGCRCCCCPATSTRPAGRDRSSSSSSTRSRPTPASTTPSAPVSRFFDRITRPEQLLTALPAAMRVLVDPVEHRRRGALAAAGRPVARVRLPGRVLRRARLDHPPTAARPGRDRRPSSTWSRRRAGR